jgi:acyl transferase domain-containing protein
MTIGLDRAHFLSPTGQCRAFDATADGYSRGEGCGIFVLKRLPDAVSENDNILGVIRGIEVNQSGLTHSITHPHAPTQMALFQRLLKNASVDAQRVNVVEAHGTGTQAGDPCELESIRSIFNADRTARNPLHVTSIKANVGHLEAASGAAGLAKLLLMFRYGVIPQQILFENLNPKIAPLDKDFTVISTEHTPWPSPQDGSTRLALLNNFGAAGSNAALLLEEFLGIKQTVHPPIGIPLVFGLSAKTSSALNALRFRYLEWLKNPENDSINFCDIAYTSTARRQMYPYRIAMVANNKKELIQQCSTATAVHVTNSCGKVVFVFSGQGSHHFDMGASLYHTFPVYKQHIDECHCFLIKHGFQGILHILTGSLVQDSGLAQQETFEAYQVAIFALEYALAKLWMSWGVSPAAVVGHRCVIQR